MQFTGNFITRAREARAVMLALVFYTYCLDYLLLTAVVPIIPDYLIEKDTAYKAEKLAESNSRKVIDNPMRQLMSPADRTMSRDNMTSFIQMIAMTKPWFHDNKTSKSASTSMDASHSGNGPRHNVTSTFSSKKTNVSKLPENLTSTSLFERALHVPVKAISENSRVGWLLSSKALVQLVCNPIVGYLSSRVSYSSLQVCGSFILLISSTLFAVAESYIPLLLARGVQGIGSAATSIAGMSMLAERYTSDSDRSRAMGVAIGGLAMGTLIGYPFGGLLYAVSGKSTPFVGIALMCVLNIGLQMIFLQKSTSKVDHIQLSTVVKLFTDPYILVCAAAIMVTSMSLAAMESTVPIWAMDNLDIRQWQIGLIFLPDSIGYLVGTNGFPVIAQKYGRWLFTVGSLFLMSIGLIVIPFSRHVYMLMLPHLMLGLGVGITDAAIMPLLALLVDRRHVTTYGSVYALNQVAVCLAYSLGPGIAGQIVNAVGFKWSMWIMALVNCLCVPACFLLRSPPIDEDKQALCEPTESSTDNSDGAEETVFAADIGTSYRSFNNLDD